MDTKSYNLFEEEGKSESAEERKFDTGYMILS